MRVWCLQGFIMPYLFVLQINISIQSGMYYMVYTDIAFPESYFCLWVTKTIKQLYQNMCT